MDMTCYTCGDRSYAHALVVCDKCKGFAVHRYCMNVVDLTEGIEWSCEYCKANINLVEQCGKVLRDAERRDFGMKRKRDGEKVFCQNDENVIFLGIQEIGSSTSTSMYSNSQNWIPTPPKPAPVESRHEPVQAPSEPPTAERASSCHEHIDQDGPYSEEYSDQQSLPARAVVCDDGSTKCYRRHSLRFVSEALQAAGQELDTGDEKGYGEGGMANKRRCQGKKHASNRSGNAPVRRGRGLGKPRAPAPPKARPELKVIGECEFTAFPDCTKIKTTIRLLTLENMPGPYRSYNMFPVEIRLDILRNFLQRYTWGPNECVKRCLDVYENIAAEVYYNELRERRKACRKKFGEEKESWKNQTPIWCKNADNWKGLCEIWSKEKWEQISTTNRSNMTKAGLVIHHVGGSKSMYRHKQSLISERGKDIGLKDLFDATHMIDTPSGKVYVNKKAQDELFQTLHDQYKGEKEEEELWELAAGGGKSGRLFGFGFRSRTCKANKASCQSPSDPMKSTANSIEYTKSSYYSPDEVTKLSEKLAAQELRYKAAMEQFQKENLYLKACIEKLLLASGMNPPPLNGPSNRDANGD